MGTSREGKLLLVVIMGRRAVGQGLTPSTPTPLCRGGGGDGGGGVRRGPQATQLPMVARSSANCKKENTQLIHILWVLI